MRPERPEVNYQDTQEVVRNSGTHIDPGSDGWTVLLHDQEPEVRFDRPWMREIRPGRVDPEVGPSRPWRIREYGDDLVVLRWVESP